MTKYKWIIFDADGTLFDYDNSEVRALTNTFVKYGLEFSPSIHEVYTQINAHLWSDLEQGRISSHQLRVQRFKQLADEMGFDYSALEFSSDYLLFLGEEGTLLPGAADVVRELSTSCQLLIATNGIADVQRRRFAASNINQYFADIVISEEIGAAKPDTMYFDVAFSRIGNPKKNEVLMVGDSMTSDIAGGSAYQIDTCWFNPSGQPSQYPVVPTYEIRDLNELLVLQSQ
jgi:2-haloacid dehalogenase